MVKKGVGTVVLEVLLGECEGLRKVSLPIQAVDGEIVQLARDLFDTMHASHLASLCAPQCGKHLRMFVTELLGERQIWINPEVLAVQGRQDSVESCASFPDLTLEVSRPETLTVRTIELNGSSVIRTVSGVLARLVAHELDHLDGVLFQDQLDSTQLFEQMMRGMDTGEVDYDGHSELSNANRPSEEESGVEAEAAGDSEWATDEELGQLLDLLNDGLWKLSLARELLRDYDLDKEEQTQLQILERLQDEFAQSVEYWETLFGS